MFRFLSWTYLKKSWICSPHFFHVLQTFPIVIDHHLKYRMSPNLRSWWYHNILNTQIFLHSIVNSICMDSGGSVKVQILLIRFTSTFASKSSLFITSIFPTFLETRCRCWSMASSILSSRGKSRRSEKNGRIEKWIDVKSHRGVISKSKSTFWAEI